MTERSDSWNERNFLHFPHLCHTCCPEILRKMHRAFFVSTKIAKKFFLFFPGWEVLSLSDWRLSVMVERRRFTRAVCRQSEERDQRDLIAASSLFSTNKIGHLGNKIPIKLFSFQGKFSAQPFLKGSVSEHEKCLAWRLDSIDDVKWWIRC